MCETNPDITPPQPDTQGWNDAYTSFCSRSKSSSEKSDSFQNQEHRSSANDSSEIAMDVSWKEVPWDHAREHLAKELLKNELQTLPTEEKSKLESDASAYWDKFYHANKNKFFKERHYLHFQFPELQLEGGNEGNSQLSGMKVLEVGSGTGSTLFPLLKQHRNTYFYAFDFSEQAVELLKTHPEYDQNRCTAFVCDIVQEDLPEFIAPASLDMILMIFVLSAMAPEVMLSVIKKATKALKPGGCLLIRDYGVYDLTQVRFLYKEGRKLSDNYYVRADGTRVYYFTTEGLENLCRSAGLITDYLKYDTRELRNRKKKINMYRVWVNGKFVKR